jgi:hypothetical protein
MSLSQCLRDYPEIMPLNHPSLDALSAFLQEFAEE